MMLITPDGHVCILFLFGPFCFAIYWRPGQKVTWEMLCAMKDTIMSAQYVLVNVRVLSTANCALDLDDLDSYRRLLHGNLLFPWMMLLHLNQYLHVSDDMCTLFFKNFISTINQFHPDYTSRIKDGYLDIVARNTRRHLTNPNENQDDLKTIVSTRPTEPLYPLYHGPVRLDKLMNVWRTPTPCLAVMC